MERHERQGNTRHVMTWHGNEWYGMERKGNAIHGMAWKGNA
jgi:hypothetical protein